MKDRAHHFARPVIFFSFFCNYIQTSRDLIEARGYSQSQIEMTKIKTNSQIALAYKYQKNSREQSNYL